MATDFPLVSVLFITYKRVHLLRRTLESFLTNTSYPNLELVVTDDGSPAPMQQEIRKLPFDKHILGKNRRGMGANANEGLRHCNGDYVLFLQDDWECCGPDSYLAHSVRVMQEDSKIGLVRFYGVDSAVNASREIRSQPLSCRMLDIPENVTNFNRYLYSDTPHLRSRSFSAQLGQYREDVLMEDCEKEFGDRFLKQNQFSAVFFPDFNNRVFVHIGETESFRTNSLRRSWELTLSTWMRPFKGSRSYDLGKQIYRKSIRLFARMRLVK